MESKLSKAEIKVIGLLEEGHSNNIISTRLKISKNTVKFHLKNIYKKLEVHNRTQAIYKLKH